MSEQTSTIVSKVWSMCTTAMNGVYEKFFAESAYPSRSAVEVARLPSN